MGYHNAIRRGGREERIGLYRALVGRKDNGCYALVYIYFLLLFPLFPLGSDCYDTSITTALGRMGTNMRLNMAILIGHPEGGPVRGRRGGLSRRTFVGSLDELTLTRTASRLGRY